MNQLHHIYTGSNLYKTTYNFELLFTSSYISIVDMQVKEGTENFLMLGRGRGIKSLTLRKGTRSTSNKH